MINLILGSVFAKIIQITLAMGTVVTLFHLSGSWIIVPGILALNFVWAYLMALHGIVCGKIILWIDRNQE